MNIFTCKQCFIKFVKRFAENLFCFHILYDFSLLVPGADPIAHGPPGVGLKYSYCFIIAVYIPSYQYSTAEYLYAIIIAITVCYPSFGVFLCFFYGFNVLLIIFSRLRRTCYNMVFHFSLSALCDCSRLIIRLNILHTLCAV
jgi:hypothetical protein